MKRIIRLTESDLSRIVRRVINEQSTTGSVKLKFLKSPGDTQRSENVYVTDIKLENNYVNFKYEIANGSPFSEIKSEGRSQYTCDDPKGEIYVRDKKNDKLMVRYLSSKGRAKLQSKCDAFASTGSDTSGDFA